MLSHEKVKFPEVIDGSMRGDFVSCGTMFNLRSCHNLTSITPSIHLHAGGVFARGCEVFRKKYYSEGSPTKGDHEACLAEAILAMFIRWGDYTPTFTWEGDLKNKGLDKLILALGLYFEEYSPASDHIQPLIRNGEPEVEFSFAIPIPGVTHPDTGDPLLYAGRFDMIGVYQDARFNVDEKTTGQFGASWSQQWKMRAQFTGYTWAANEYGNKVVGTIVRGVRFTTKAIDFAECITYRPQWEIDRWLEQLIRDAKRMVQAYESGIFDYNLDSSCASYGGCQYRVLCESNQPERWVDGYFARRIWNPLAQDPEEEEDYVCSTN